MAEIEKWRDPDSNLNGGLYYIDTSAITTLEKEKKLETTGKDVGGKPILIELGTSTISIPVIGPSVMEKTTSKIETRD